MGRHYAGVPEEILYPPNIDAGFEKLRREGMPEAMGRCLFGDGGPSDRLLEYSLVGSREHMVPRLGRTRVSWVRAEPFVGPYPEPAPFLSCVGVLVFYGVGQVDSGGVVLAVFLVESSGEVNLLLKLRDDRLGENSLAVLSSLGAAHANGHALEVEVLNAESAELGNTESAGVLEEGHEPLLTGELVD